MPDPRLAPLVAGLALATEAAAGVPPETASRAAILSVHIAREMGLDAPLQRDAMYATLLRYIGCSGLAHETAEYGGGDDIGFLRMMTPADTGSFASVVSHVVKGAGRDRGPLGRVQSIARALSNPKIGQQIATAHCEQAVSLAEPLGLGPRVREALAQMYERWDGKGGPNALAGDATAIIARVLRVAYCLELHRAFHGAEASVVTLMARRGGEVDPGIVDRIAPRARELVGLVDAPSVWEALLEVEPAPVRTLSLGRVPEVAMAFAHFVDLKSPYTLSHSTGVADLAVRAMARDGAPEEERERVRIAALLHDLGRTSVANGIWDKQGKLGVLERERVEDHATASARILGRGDLLAPYARLVSAHHERLDGTGYPRGAAGPSLDRAARVLAAADVRHALGEERAYREARTAAEAARVMSEEVRAGRLDRDAVELVLAAAGDRVPSLKIDLPAGLSEREAEVMRLLARGLSNAIIGKKLFISPRTVGHHVAHIYDKTGVRTRAATALFAVQHGLVEE